MHRRYSVAAIISVVLLLSVLSVTSSCSDDEEVDLFVITLVDTSRVGSIKTCWDQKDHNGKQVSAGQYNVRMTAEDFVSTKTLVIGTDPNIPLTGSCEEDTTNNVMPLEFQLLDFMQQFRVGDTIRVQYAVPVRTQVQIQIFR
ncbi:MAG: hypothetical protein IPH59_09530 [bacterium]|nr:hypothetical protein [bacterium]